MCHVSSGTDLLDSGICGGKGALAKSRRGLPGTSQVPFRPAWVPSSLASVHVGQVPAALEVPVQAQVVQEPPPVSGCRQEPPQGVEEHGTLA